MLIGKSKLICRRTTFSKIKFVNVPICSRSCADFVKNQLSFNQHSRHLEPVLGRFVNKPLLQSQPGKKKKNNKKKIQGKGLINRNTCWD